MKKYIMIAVAIFGLSTAYAQKQVSADSLKYYEDKVVMVCSKVTDTFVTKTPNKTTFLSFGSFPAQLFTVVIYEEHLKNFSYSPAAFLKGKEVCVIGDVVMYDSGPEIIVEREDQIRMK